MHTLFKATLIDVHMLIEKQQVRLMPMQMQYAKKYSPALPVRKLS